MHVNTELDSDRLFRKQKREKIREKIIAFFDQNPGAGMSLKEIQDRIAHNEVSPWVIKNIADNLTTCTPVYLEVSREVHQLKGNNRSVLIYRKLKNA